MTVGPGTKITLGFAGAIMVSSVPAIGVFLKASDLNTTVDHALETVIKHGEKLASIDAHLQVLTDNVRRFTDTFVTKERFDALELRVRRLEDHADRGGK